MSVARAVVLAGAVLAGCSGARGEGAGRAPGITAAEVMPGGARVPEPGASGFAPEGGDGGVGLAVAADAGVNAAELAWLVAHIADGPSALHPTDTMNVRSLAARGGEGVRAVAPVFRRGDAARARYARRVVERVALHACRRDARDEAQRLVLWLELGRVPDAVLHDAGLMVWTRADDAPWPDDAIARLLAWARAGTPCGPVELGGGDAGLADATVMER
jgi:hypothetical protein